MKKNVNNNDLNVDQMQVYFEQALASVINAQFYIEYLAFLALPRDKYQKVCENVADYTKKVCTNQKKVVNLQSDSKENGAESPTLTESEEFENIENQ